MGEVLLVLPAVCCESNMVSACRYMVEVRAFVTLSASEIVSDMGIEVRISMCERTPNAAK